MESDDKMGREFIPLFENWANSYDVAVNAIFHNDRVPELNDYLSFLDEAGADAVVFNRAPLLFRMKIPPCFGSTAESRR